VKSGFFASSSAVIGVFSSYLPWSMPDISLMT